ncbi:MAG TPA: diaminopimelate decarboxylase, partial [Candidatus Solibacter sp.]|nr:diaminopimelate decarboxylase [Candidatus Solibacter sp.]
MFSYSGSDYYCEQTPLADIARRAGTPCYVYSSEIILSNYRAYTEAFADLPHTVCYAVKANSSLAILGLLAKAGAGFDIVSGGELYRVLAAGGDPAKVVFSGVGKTAAEVEYGLAKGIHSFNCESETELALIDAMAARLGVTAGFSIRVNPDVDAVTHPYISTGLSQHKFGIAIAEAAKVYEQSRQFKNLAAEGVSCHIGSQILDPSPILEAVGKVLALAASLREQGHPIKHLDLGGGLGVAYHEGEQAPQIREFVSCLRARVKASGLAVMVEPGRSIVGPAGVLLTRVLYRKQNGAKEFIVVDAAMNDLIRPSLYKAHHEILPWRKNGLP